MGERTSLCVEIEIKCKELETDGVAGHSARAGGLPASAKRSCDVAAMQWQCYNTDETLQLHCGNILCYLQWDTMRGRFASCAVCGSPTARVQTSSSCLIERKRKPALGPCPPETSRSQDPRLWGARESDMPCEVHNDSS